MGTLVEARPWRGAGRVWARRITAAGTGRALRGHVLTVGLSAAAAGAWLTVARSSLAPLPVIAATLALFQLAALLVARCLARPRPLPPLLVYEAVLADPGPGAVGPARARFVRVAARSEAAARDLLRPLGAGETTLLRLVEGPARRAGVLRVGHWVPTAPVSPAR